MNLKLYSSPVLLFGTSKLSVATWTVMTSYQQLSFNFNRLMSMTTVQILSTDEDHVVWSCKRTLSWIKEILTWLIQRLWDVLIISELLQLLTYIHSFYSDMIICNTFKCAEIWDCSTVKTIDILHSLQTELLVQLWPPVPAAVLCAHSFPL